MTQDLVAKSLELLVAGDLNLGSALDEAHQICQDFEGTPAFDWVHAFIHRIEGDDANAAYWYRRAGKVRHPGSIREEWQLIHAELSHD